MENAYQFLAKIFIKLKRHIRFILEEDYGIRYKKTPTDKQILNDVYKLSKSNKQFRYNLINIFIYEAINISTYKNFNQLNGGLNEILNIINNLFDNESEADRKNFQYEIDKLRKKTEKKGANIYTYLTIIVLIIGIISGFALYKK